MGLVPMGEEGGALPRHLLEIAKTLEEEVERALKVVTTLLEPCLMLAMKPLWCLMRSERVKWPYFDKVNSEM